MYNASLVSDQPPTYDQKPRKYCIFIWFIRGYTCGEGSRSTIEIFTKNNRKFITFLTLFPYPGVYLNINNLFYLH